MKQLVVISGKGGTGKTVVSASLAVLACNKVMADCDVDAANLHLLLHPEIEEEHSFSGGKKARVNFDDCTACGRCLEVCRFGAVVEEEDGKVSIDQLSCEGCGICSYVCPESAVEMEKSISGQWFVSRTKYGPFVHARLGIGEENSGKLVTRVRQKAVEFAEQNGFELIIIDGPPGTGCPVIASLSGADEVLVVTEPSLSGIHDMERVVQVARHFKAEPLCCINKFNLNEGMTDRIEKWCRENSVPLVGKIPYDEIVIKSVVAGIPLVEFSENQSAREIQKMWEKLEVK
ncbi:MAG: ATP-binding protein [Acidobacteriota bacterium]